MLDHGEPCVVVDARPHNEFRKHHIAGAVNIEWESWCEPAPGHAAPIIKEPGYWGALADPIANDFAGRLEAFGLSNNKKAIVYAGGQASKGRDGRVAWTLLYLGCREVMLLDGGYPVWLASGGASETKIDTPERGSFRLELKHERRCNLESVKQWMSKATAPVLVDTRSKAEYAGRVFDYQPRKGHIPGSKLFPYKELFDKKGDFVCLQDFKRLLDNAIKGSNLIAYCEVGVRAALFALIHEIYTGEVVPVYDGSFMEWSLDEDNPVEA